jgi:hypothetical protein
MKKVLHGISYVYHSIALGFWIINTNYHSWLFIMRSGRNPILKNVQANFWHQLNYSKTLYEAD